MFERHQSNRGSKSFRTSGVEFRAEYFGGEHTEELDAGS
jgi:hypothetical protein